MRVILLVVAVVVGLGVAVVPFIISLSGGEGQSANSDPAASTGSATPTGSDSGAGPVDSVGTRYDVAAGQRMSCPGGTSGAAEAAPSGSELGDLTLPCLTDGGSTGSVPLAAALAGKPTLVNVWAWWCQPCRAELPVLQEAAEKHPEWNIVGVHENGQGQAGADLLRELGVRLAMYQDSTGAFTAAASLPAVIPVSVVYRADGTRAAFHPGEITSVAELEKIMAAAQ